MNIRFLPIRSESNNGLSPLYCRITIDKERSQFSTKIYIDPDHWDSKNQIFLGIKKKAVNLALAEIVRKLITLSNQLQNKQISYTPKSLRNYFLNGIGDRITLSQLFDMYITHSRTVNELASTSLSKYETLKKKVIRYGDQQDIRHIPKVFAFQFHDFLKTTCNLSHNTSVKAMELLRSVLNFGIAQELIDKSPLSGYKLKKQKKGIVYLTRDELDRIENKQFVSDRLDFVRDVFVFQCYTGMEYSRAMNAELDDIQIGLDGEPWILTERIKTGERSNVPLLDNAAEIIDKYRDESRKTIFPGRSNQKMNEYLKEIATLCNIEKNLTTHMSRHTFATTICLLNGISMEATSKMLGHGSIKTTERHYGVIAPKRIVGEVKGLREKFAKGKFDKTSKNKKIAAKNR